MQTLDDNFYDRADAHILLSNDQISEEITKGKVSASMMYATARFNSWISASSFSSSEEMKAGKNEAVEYFVSEYRKMLEENMDDYIDNFQDYMQSMTR
jgi:threonyl-tRNA synthetase